MCVCPCVCENSLHIPFSFQQIEKTQAAAETPAGTTTAVDSTQIPAVAITAPSTEPSTEVAAVTDTPAAAPVAEIPAEVTPVEAPKE